MHAQAVNTILYSGRFDECVAFYTALPGFTPAPVNAWFVEFAVGGAFISVADAGRTSIAAGDGAGLTLTFRVDDADTVHAELLRQGVDTTPPRDHPWGARTFYVFDPDGRRLEFWSPRET